MTTCYTIDQRRDFERYCSDVAALVDRTRPVPFDGTCARVHKCECGDAIPAGIPDVAIGTEWDRCPRCVQRVYLVRIEVILNDGLPDLTVEQRHAMLSSSYVPAAVKKAIADSPAPKRTRLDATIDRLEVEHDAATDDGQRDRLFALLQAARNARTHQGANT